MSAPLVDALNTASAEFIEHYKDHPSYKEAVFKLKQAMFEIDLLTMSPGRREAMAAATPNQTGQSPKGDTEAAMEAQH